MEIKPKFFLVRIVGEEDLSGGHHVEILEHAVPFVGGGNDVVFVGIAGSGAFSIGAKRRRLRKTESLRKA